MKIVFFLIMLMTLSITGVEYLSPFLVEDSSNIVLPSTTKVCFWLASIFSTSAFSYHMGREDGLSQGYSQ